MKVGILGILGRMGNTLASLTHGDPTLTLVGGTYKGARPSTPQLTVPLYQEPETHPLFMHSEVLIDFTAPDALETHLAQARTERKPLVIGTTGLSDTQKALLEQVGKDIPVFYAPNMSLSVHYLAQLAEQMARVLKGEYDVEISETHHRHKKDAPSGTSLRLGQAVAKGYGKSFDEIAIVDRVAHPAARQPYEIGFAVQRGGGVCGDHAITFLGEHDVIEISHRALDRTIFAQGALTAARWLVHQPAGLYHMHHMVAA